MRISKSIALLLALVPVCSFAQHARVLQFSTPLAGKVVLKDVADKYNANIYSLEAPEVDDDMERLSEIKYKTSLRFPRKKTHGAHKTTTAQTPVLGINFISDSLSGIPPDNCSAVSKGGKTVSVMNSYIAVHDAVSGAFLYRRPLGTFAISLGLTGSNDYKYDPKVLYDPEADRFICIILSGTVQYNNVVVAFSQTNDPAGGWNFYKFYGDYNSDTTWFDYPAISITQSEFFFTGNKIKYDSTWQAGFTQTLIYQVHKQDGYNGAAALSYQIWDSIRYNDRPLRCLYPLNQGSALLGPSQYFLSNRNFDVLNDTVFLVKVPDTIGSGNTNLTVTPVISSISYGVPPNASQPDTSVVLATNDGRVLGGFIEGDEIQFVSTSVNPLNGASSVYLGKISSFSTTPVLQGQIFSIDTLDFGYPNISFAGNYEGNNHSIISFEYSGLKTFPGFGAILFDGSSFSEMLTIKSGLYNIKKLFPDKIQRWGDYTGSQRDWNTLGTVWVNGIYGARVASSINSYGNYMAQLMTPYHLGVRNVQPQPKTTSKVFPNPAGEYVSFEFNTAKEQVYSFVIYDAQGRVADKIADMNCHAGRNIIQFNIAPLAPGSYLLKATGVNGENIEVHTFVRR